MDLSSIPLDELRKLEKDVAALIARRESETLTKLQADILDLVGKSGFGLKEVLEPLLAKGKGVLAPRYRNPANHDQVWMGRGKRPRWLQELLDAGQSLEALQLPG